VLHVVVLFTTGM